MGPALVTKAIEPAAAAQWFERFSDFGQSPTVDNFVSLLNPDAVIVDSGLALSYSGSKVAEFDHETAFRNPRSPDQDYQAPHSREFTVRGNREFRYARRREAVLGRLLRRFSHRGQCVALQDLCGPRGYASAIPQRRAGLSWICGAVGPKPRRYGGQPSWPVGGQ